MKNILQLRESASWIGIILLVVAGLGCEIQSNPYSETFQGIFGENSIPSGDTLVFRGVGFGSSLDEVKKLGLGDPVYADDFGLTYNLNAQGISEATVEYLQNPNERSGVGSILVEISLNEEYEAVRFYREIESHLNLYYGPPSGFQGNYSWSAEDYNTRAFLRLDDSKKRITLNFLPLLQLKPTGVSGNKANTL